MKMCSLKFALTNIAEHHFVVSQKGLVFFLQLYS
jgi:hypothetical protein